MSMPVIAPSNIEKDEALNALIQSIALEQTALSHILNAEGETIQSLIGECDYNKKIEVAKSVRSIFDAATRLQILLLQKVEVLDGYINCNNDCKIKPPKPCQESAPNPISHHKL